jgi:hypothetical protein
MSGNQPTSYEINREHILKYMKKRPDAVDQAQRKYFNKPEIKEKLKDYNKEYYAWMKYINNDTFKYQAQLLRDINIP